MQLAHEATKCEEKEEKLVKDAVQHLTQANIQIKDLHHQFTHKVSTYMHRYLEEARKRIIAENSQICLTAANFHDYSHDIRFMWCQDSS